MIVNGKSYPRIDKIESFRLLNSEIGNDHSWWSYQFRKIGSFRLLNSEIGNDQSKEQNKMPKMTRFSSP